MLPVHSTSQQSDVVNINMATINYSAPVGKRSFALSLFVCLSVCEPSETAGLIFTKVQIPCGRGSVRLWRHCDMLCTSSFTDDIMFGRSGPYGDAWKAHSYPSTASGVAILGRSLLSMNALF